MGGVHQEKVAQRTRVSVGQFSGGAAISALRVLSCVPSAASQTCSKVAVPVAMWKMVRACERASGAFAWFDRFLFVLRQGRMRTLFGEDAEFQQNSNLPSSDGAFFPPLQPTGLQQSHP